MLLAGCSPENGATDNVVPQENVINDFSSEIVSTENVLLSMSSPMAEPGTSVSRTLTATVLPATATNKAVDWHCEWVDASNTANVSDYVTVTPASSGSTTATVTCYQAFTSNVIITVITRESGYSATCVVSFIGIPTDIGIKSFYDTAKNDDMVVVLFRFAATDYYSAAVDIIELGKGFLWSDKFTKGQAYRAFESVFFDFDIIQLSFQKDGIYTVIPVVASPIDIVNAITPPVNMPDGLAWWVWLVLALIIIVVLVVLSIIIKPIAFIITLALKIIALPFKLLGKLFKALFKKRGSG